MFCVRLICIARMLIPKKHTPFDSFLHFFRRIVFCFSSALSIPNPQNFTLYSRVFFSVNLPSIDQIYSHSHTNKSSHLSTYHNFIAFYFISFNNVWRCVVFFPYFNMLKRKKAISLLNVHVRVTKGNMHTHYDYYIEPYTAVSYWVCFCVDIANCRHWRKRSK